MVDSSEKLCQLNSLEFKEEPTSGQEFVVKDELIIKDDVDVNWNGKTNDEGKDGESIKCSQDVEDLKPISICLESGTILEGYKQNSHQNQSLNITLKNSLKQDEIYSCEKCSYQCKEKSMLNFHTQLIHSSGQIVINIDKINDPHKKCVNLTLKKEIPKVLSIEYPNTKDNGDQDVNPLLSQDKKNCVEKEDVKAPIAKVCTTCSDTITTKVTVTDRCRTCNFMTKFRCNQCNRLFPSYQKVSQHLWTECLCLDCDYRSPYKFGVYCDKYHPRPVEAATESNAHELDSGNGVVQNVYGTKPMKGSISVAMLRELKKFTQFIIWYCPTCKTESKLKSSFDYNYIQSCQDCTSVLWCKCAKCKKSYKKWHEYLLNHLTVCYKSELGNLI